MSVRKTAATATPAAAPDFSPFGYRLFVRYLRSYFARNFTAVRTSGLGSPPLESLPPLNPLPPLDPLPLIVYSNHPSWWDPIHFGLLASYLHPELRVYGPMDSAALEKYRFFKKLGVFGVDRSRRGAAAFLRTSLAALAQPRASLWMTAEGQFTDPRQRPVHILPGVAHLARRLDAGWIVPLALEYPFWNERRPEALSRFGRPICLARQPVRSTRDWTSFLEERLVEALEALASDASSRDTERFVTLQTGGVGVGGVYDLWRRGKALMQGRHFDAAHGDGAS